MRVYPPDNDELKRQQEDKDMNDRIAQLEEDVKRYRAAIEWAIKSMNERKKYRHEVAEELRALAFPPTEPEYEEVEVKRWECKTCGEMFKSQNVSGGKACCWGGDALIPLTGTRRVKKVPKVKCRAEIPRTDVADPVVGKYVEGTKFYREWWQ